MPDRTEYLASPLKRRITGRSHYLIQFDGGVRSEVFGQLRDRGITVTGYLPQATLMIGAPDDFTLEGLHVVWVSRLEHRDKISPLVSSSPSALHAYIVEFHSDVDMNEARSLVREHRVQMIENSDLAPHHLLVRATPDGLSRLASWDEVAYIFPAAPELVSHKPVRACGSAIVHAAAVAQNAGSAYSWPVDGSSGLVLNYVFSQLTEKLPPASTQSELLRAFGQWAGVANVQFVSGTNPSALRTINILFASGTHGDAYPFDGPGGVLAHTFYPAPPNPEPIAGDMHLDDDERWQIGADTDLYTVALHEAGHALGLVHTDNPNDVMYPYYRFGKQLSSNDIAIVQSLYGANPTQPTPTPSSPLLLTIATPPATTTAASVSLSGTVSGGTAPVQVTWQTAGGASGTAAGSPNWMASVPLAVGANVISITATDSAGHTASQMASVVRQQPPAPAPPPAPSPNPPSPAPPPPGPKDTTAPSLTITYPAASVVSTAASTITFRGMATENVGVTSVTWSNSTGTAGTATGTITWTASIPLSSGTNNIIFKAFDAAGNFAWRSVTVVHP
ncbi:MAG TPA: matrixin family metalloprotease [Bryobacteraceae bacterium]|nr:matrixin family metalloprotease [Bryobacteraceae bacterium]